MANPPPRLGFRGRSSLQQIMLIRPYQLNDEDGVTDLWNRCGLTRPWNDPKKDIARKRSIQPEWFLVGVRNDQVIATVMVGYEGHRGWINYLAVNPDHQRAGFGRAMMAEAERILMDLGCPKINLQIRNDNQKAIAFYERIGFINDSVISFGKRLVSDE